MPTIWGCLEHVEESPQGPRWIQVRIMLAGGTPIRTRAFVREHVLIARGTERIPLSHLRQGELVEVTYRHGTGGLLEAETIYVRPDPVVVFSK